jgi:hypothetical protein
MVSLLAPLENRGALTDLFGGREAGEDQAEGGCNPPRWLCAALEHDALSESLSLLEDGAIVEPSERLRDHG